MKPDRFGNWCFSHVLKGQQELADTLRMLVYKKNQELFEKLEFDNDDCFLNPFLFAWFTAGDSDFPFTRVFEEYSIGKKEYSPRLGNSSIAIFTRIHPLLERFFSEPSKPSVEAVAARQGASLNKAFSLMQAHCPDLALALAACVRGVLLYSAAQPNSFAALSAHGMVCFNVPDDADEVFFLEDLAHQGAHVLFNAMTFDKKRYLAVDPAFHVAQWPGHANDTRDVYTVFHALSTYPLICRVLSTLRERGVLQGRQAHELAGRLAITLKKFASDLALLERPALFTPRGRLVYRRFAAQHARYMARDGHLAKKFDFSGQPYNFCYATFAARNPMEEEAAEEALAP